MDLRGTPDARGRGIGHALLCTTEAFVRAAGIAGIAVETQDINIAACELYSRAGFTIARVATDAYRDLPDETQIIWTKSFDHSARFG